MNNNQYTKTSLILIFLLIIGTWFLVIPNKVMAQAVSLSVSPPLYELMIQPGKEVKQSYTISNNGGDTTVTPNLVYFTPSEDGLGNVELTEDSAPDWVKYSKESIKIKGGEKQDFNILISPPAETEEVDIFLTLTFESSEAADILNQNSSFFKSKIGTNILITISKDGYPKKSAEIAEFKAPKVIDSFFGEINYSIILKNNGNSFWKPIGKIITDNETLKIAPQNIISGTNRKIICIDNENLINCQLKSRFLIGKVFSKLEFTLDEEPKIYKVEFVTYAIPFSMILIILIAALCNRLLTKYNIKEILKVWKKGN